MSREVNYADAANWSDDEVKANLHYLDVRGDTYGVQEALKILDKSWGDVFSSPEPEVFPQPDAESSVRSTQGSSYPEPVEAKGGEVPDGTVKEVLDWVGDDKSRAEAALAAEDEKGEDARITLVEQLEAIAGEDADEEA